jgi:hypothetical protein
VVRLAGEKLSLEGEARQIQINRADWLFNGALQIPEHNPRGFIVGNKHLILHPWQQDRSKPMGVFVSPKNGHTLRVDTQKRVPTHM